MGKDGLTQTLINIFTSPMDAFRSLKSKPRTLFPLLLLIACNVGMTLVYMRSVDIPWLLETQMQTSAAQLTDDQRRQAIERISKVSPTLITTVSGVQAAVVMLILLFLPAAYLAIVSMLTNDGYKLSRWFALVCWCSLPLLLGVLASLVNVLAGDASHLAPEKLNPLSFSNLFEVATPPRNVADRVLHSIGVTSVWSLALLVFGYQAWTERSLAKSAGIVLAPMIVLFAIILFFTLR